MTLEPWFRRRPLTGYFALAYGISWGGILILYVARGLDLAALQPLNTGLMFVFMRLGPSTSGLAPTALLDGRTGLRRLLASLMRWRFGGALVRGRTAYDAVAPVRDPGALERLRGPGVRAPFPMAATAAVGSLFGTIV